MFQNERENEHRMSTVKFIIRTRSSNHTSGFPILTALQSLATTPRNPFPPIKELTFRTKILYSGVHFCRFYTSGSPIENNGSSAWSMTSDYAMKVPEDV